MRAIDDLDDLDTTVQTLRVETGHDPFVGSLAHAVTLLGGIPDLPRCLAPAEMIRLRELVDEIVDAIEHRIDSGVDQHSTRKHLAGTVYEVRRRMEAIEVWHRGVTRGPA